MDAFQFIKDVALDWDKSVYLEAEPGYYLTITRREKGTGNWFLGNVNGNEERTAKVNFDFLEEGKSYIATIYSDTKDAHYRNNPQSYEIRKVIVTKKSKLSQFSAPGGGFAMSIMEAEKADLKGLKKL
jgi:hypothetical protein